MKISPMLFSVFAAVLFTISLVLANPTTLPKHPGCPMGKAVDPVKGQPSQTIQDSRTPQEKNP
jgi:hypothetical protein